MSTFGELKAQVQRNCGNRDNDEFLASIMFNVNMVLGWLATQCEWKELQKTSSPSWVVDQQDYTKAQLSLTDVKTIYSIKFFDGTYWSKPLRQMTSVRMDEEFGNTTISGDPEAFAEYAGSYRFNCPAASAYQLKISYLAKPTKVTGDNSTIVYEDLDGAIVCLTSGFCWMGLGDSSIADRWFKVGSEQLKAIGIDTTSLLNFQATPRGGGHNGSQPWNNPFTRRT